MVKYKWESAAKRTIQSEKIELKSLPGYWFKAKKYSVSGYDEIQRILMAKMRALSPEVRAAIMRANEEGKPITEYLVDPTCAADIIAQLEESFNTAELMKLSLVHGLGDTNLIDGEITEDGTKEELVDIIMEYADIASEIYQAVQEWNRPLAQKTATALNLQQNGHIEE